jgi:non-specific serine/threonine protein kinase/serine/threonine-protein kinase
MPDSPPGPNDAAMPITSAPTQVVREGASPSTVIGSYHLFQKIAEGGMGEVWLAEQKHPVRRRVALKLIKAGLDSREIALRFESERQALALMDHPAIAKVYEAGSTAQGTPYFAMEYVPGVPISAFCDNHKLSTRQRLELFVRVCEGVQHAHQKAIIHRDLKPSNILVSEVDGRPAPKIIDFGVAKALSQRLTDETMFTRVGSIVGTPEFMSPEQAASGGEDIDTRTDVYSLGVILYELLAGARPIDLASSSYFEFVRKLREEDTPKPSTKLRSGGPLSEEAATNRGTQWAILAKELRGDLDCIVLKCLEKDRRRRYGSPSELSADIGRYLEDLPVLAAPPSARYRLQKFAQRNRGVLAAVCGLLLILLAGTAVSLYQAVRARTAEHAALLQRDRADSEAATAEAVSDFLRSDLLSQAGVDQQTNPNAAPDPDVKVRTLVDRAAAGVAKKFGGKPLVEADLRQTLGETYLSLGLVKEATAQFQQSYEINSRSRGPLAKQTIEALQGIGGVEFNVGKYEDATRHTELAFESSRRAFGAEAPLTVQLSQSLAVDYMELGQNAKAETLLKKALQLQLKSDGYDSASTLDTSDSLAFLYMKEGRNEEARKLLERGLEGYRKVYGPDHPNTQREIFGLTRLAYNTGDYQEAEQLCMQVLDSNRRLLGPMHFKTLAAARMLAQTYEAEGKLQKADALMADTLRKLIVSVGNESAETLYDRQEMARIYETEGAYSKAESLLRDAEASADRVYGSSHADAILAKQLLGADLLRQRRCEEAAGYLEEANRRWQKSSSESWHRFETQSLLGAALACEHKYSEAEPLLLSGYQGLKQSESKMRVDQQITVKEAANRLASLRADGKQLPTH